MTTARRKTCRKTSIIPMHIKYKKSPGTCHAAAIEIEYEAAKPRQNTTTRDIPCLPRRDNILSLQKPHIGECNNDTMRQAQY